MCAFYISVCLTLTAASHLSVEANLSVLVTERLNLKVCVCVWWGTRHINLKQ